MFLYTKLLLYDLGYHSLLYSLIGSIIAYTISINFLSFALNSCDIYLIKSITLTFFSLFLSLKTFIISRLLIRGIVLSSLFISVCAK